MAVNSQVQILRGTTDKAGAYVGKVGELVYDIGKKTVRALDGTTAGGSVLAKEAIKLKTDSDNLLKFNAAAEADHSADITITLDKEAVSTEVINTIKDDTDLKKELAELTVETIAADEDLKGDIADAVIDGFEADATRLETLAADIAPKIVSAKTDNYLEVASGTSEDGLLYVKKPEASDFVKSGDAILFVGSDDKIATNLQFDYDNVTGKLTVKGGSAGTTLIKEMTIPTSLTLLKTAEVVTNPSGQAEGTYLHFVFATQAGAGHDTADVYINVTSFIDVYTAGDGLKLNASDDHKFEVNLVASGNQAKISSGQLLVPTDYGTLE